MQKCREIRQRANNANNGRHNIIILFPNKVRVTKKYVILKVSENLSAFDKHGSRAEGSQKVRIRALGKNMKTCMQKCSKNLCFSDEIFLENGSEKFLRNPKTAKTPRECSKSSGSTNERHFHPRDRSCIKVAKAKSN